MSQNSKQVYFLVEQIGGQFGTGAGEEYTDADPNDPGEGVYIPVWMPIDELPRHEKIFPVKLAELVIMSYKEGWDNVPVSIFEEPR